MCELFGMSASGAAAVEGPLGEFRLRGGVAADNPDGWGLASWDNGAFHVFKEPEPAAQSMLFAELCEAVRSNLIVAHVRKARYPPINTMTNTHPFKHTCCGKEWVFAHNGLVPAIVDLELGSENPVCRPTGQTDSEYAFCHLLGYIAQQLRDTQPSDAVAWFQTLATVSELVASHGKFNFLMSDGEYLVAYGHDRLHHSEQHNSDSANNKPLHRVLVATEPLNGNEEWIAFEPGELRVYHLGRLAGRMTTHPARALGTSANRSFDSTPMAG
jgi:glutamine amidotransferase